MPKEQELGAIERREITINSKDFRARPSDKFNNNNKEIKKKEKTITLKLKAFREGARGQDQALIRYKIEIRQFTREI